MLSYFHPKPANRSKTSTDLGHTRDLSSIFYDLVILAEILSSNEIWKKYKTFRANHILSENQGYIFITMRQTERFTLKLLRKMSAVNSMRSWNDCLMNP